MTFNFESRILMKRYNKILLVFALFSSSALQAKLIEHSNGLYVDIDSILVLKNPSRVTFTTYYKIDNSKYIKSHTVLDCNNQTYYSTDNNTLVNKNFEYIISIPITEGVPTKEKPRDLVKYSLPHTMYETVCPK